MSRDCQQISIVDYNGNTWVLAVPIKRKSMLDRYEEDLGRDRLEITTNENGTLTNTVYAPVRNVPKVYYNKRTREISINEPKTIATGTPHRQSSHNVSDLGGLFRAIGTLAKVGQDTVAEMIGGASSQQIGSSALQSDRTGAGYATGGGYMNSKMTGGL